MIQFTGTSARDTFSYRELDFAILPGLSAIEGANGTSKSSLFLTLQQGLFNRNAKGCKVDEVNNVITGEPYEIVVPFTKNGDEYRVVNSRKDARIDIYKNGKNIALKRIPDNLALIQEILGCDFNMFCDLTYQNKDSSLDLLETGTDKGRKQFINRVLRLAEIDEQFTRMKDKEKELSGKTGKIEHLRYKIERLHASLAPELEVEEEEPVTAYQESRVALDEEIELLKEEKRCMEFTVNTVEERWQKRDAELAAHNRLKDIERELSLYEKPAASVPELQAYIDSVREQETSLWVSTRDLETDIANALAVVAKRRQKQAYQDEIAGIELGCYSKKELQDLVDLDNAYFASEPVILKQIRAKIDEFEAAIASGDCPTCGAKVPREMFEADVELLKQEGRRRKAELEGRKEAHAQFKGALEQYERKEKLEREVEWLDASMPEAELDIEAARVTLEAQRTELITLQQYIRDEQEKVTVHYRIAELEQEADKLRASLSGADPYEDLDQLREGYRAALKKIEEDLTLAEARRETLFESLTAIETRNATIRAHKEINKKIQANNTMIMLEVDQATKELEDSERRLDLVREWLGILGNKGYRVAKIDRFLRSLNSTMQKYSQLICDGRIRACFFITSDGEIDFTITDEAKSMDYTLWSGGEKARVRLVTLFAVLELLEVMGSVSFNVLCLDEVFDQLDADGKAGLFRVLEYLKERQKALYVIAHSELALDLVYDAVIKASKNQDGTTQLLQ